MVDNKAMSCENCKHDAKMDSEYPCSGCIHNALDMFEPKTNMERIRAMDADELSEFLLHRFFTGLGSLCCKEKKECRDVYERGDMLGLMACQDCLIEWLGSTKWDWGEPDDDY